MTKNEVKELIGIIVFSIINITIAYIITEMLGIQNVILYQSIATAMQYTITYEILIFFALSFIESFIYEKRIV